MNPTLLRRPSQSPHFRASILLAVATVIFAVFAIVPIGSIGSTEAKPKIGKLPSETVANHPLRTLDGRNFSLSQLRGKVVVLDFFAVWCGYSRQHIPAMTEFGEAEIERGLQIIGLAVNDAESTPDRVRKFIAEMKIDYPVGLISDPEFTRYVDSRDISVPQTLVYARDGRLAAHFSGHDGRIEKELVEAVHRELEKR